MLFVLRIYVNDVTAGTELKTDLISDKNRLNFHVFLIKLKDEISSINCT